MARNDNASQKLELTTRQRVLYGGLGALTPILLNLIVVDIHTVLQDLNGLTLAGYLIRVGALFALGGMVAMLNQDEEKPSRIFQLGISAPALAMALINGGGLASETVNASVRQAAVVAPAPVGSWFFIPTVHAQEREPRREIRVFARAEETAVQQLYRGLFGIRGHQNNFVIVAAYPAKGKAEEAARRIDGESGLSAELYSHPANELFYVVVGADLSDGEAVAVLRKARDAGFGSAYAWAFSDKSPPPAPQ